MITRFEGMQEELQEIISNHAQSLLQKIEESSLGDSGYKEEYP
jgi:hypothetical protein